MCCRQGRADAHVVRPGVKRGVPITGVDNGYLWSRAPEASDAPHDEVAGEDLRRQCFVESSVDRWIFGYLGQTKSDDERNRAVWAKELQVGGYFRVVVRCDGEPALLAVKGVRWDGRRADFAARIRFPVPEVRRICVTQIETRVYTGRDVEIRKYGASSG